MLTTARAVISRLPEGCGYELSLTDNCCKESPAELEVFPADNPMYYAIAADWRLQPEHPEEISTTRGILLIVIYRPDAWKEKQS